MIAWETVVVLASIASLYVIVLILKALFKEKLSKTGLDIEGFAIVLKTTKLNSWIEREGEKHSGLWKLVGDTGIVSGLLLATFGAYTLHLNLFNFFLQPKKAGAVVPVIPGVTVGLDILPYFMIALALILIPHELFHGLIAAAHKLKIKSAGMVLFLIFPGGFIEPDEEKLKSSRLRHQLRVYSAGSLANLIVFIILYLLFSLLLSLSLISSAGICVSDVLPGYPADGVLRKGDTIVSVNGTAVKTLEEFTEIMSKAGVGNRITLGVVRDSREMVINVTTVASPDGRAIIGIRTYEMVKPYFVYNAIWLSMVFSISVAIINILPIYPLDGGLIVMALLNQAFKNERTARKITFTFSIYFAAILILNVIFSLGKWGFKVPWP